MTKSKKIELKTPETLAIEERLQSACDEARGLLLSAEAGGVDARYHAAVIIRDVMESGSYGSGAVRKMQKVLGFSEKSLWRFVGVAKAWTEDEFKNMSAKKGKKDRPISWSALLFLSAIENPEQRATLTDRALNEGLTIRQLRDATKPQAQAGVHVHKVVAQVRKQAALLAESCKFWGDQVMPLLNQSKAELTEADLVELRGQVEYLGRVASYLGGLPPQLMEALTSPSQSMAPAQFVAPAQNMYPANQAAIATAV